LARPRRVVYLVAGVVGHVGAPRPARVGVAGLRPIPRVGLDGGSAGPQGVGVPRRDPLVREHVGHVVDETDLRRDLGLYGVADRHPNPLRWDEVAAPARARVPGPGTRG